MRQIQKNTNSIAKALIILSSFTPYNQEMGATEIAKKIGFHKATVSRILKILTFHGYLNQNSRTKKFSLGPSVMDLARAVNQSLKTNFVLIAKPFIDDLRNRLKETVILEVLSGESTLMAYIAEGPRLVRLAGSIGDRVPIHAAAGGKAILAFSPPEVAKTLLNRKLYPFTEHTITDPEVLWHQLEGMKARGITFDNEEIDEGTCAVGAPIFNHNRIPVGAVVVAGPSQRINWENDSEMAYEVKNTAAKISAQLYYGKALPENRSGGKSKRV